MAHQFWSKLSNSYVYAPIDSDPDSNSTGIHSYKNEHSIGSSDALVMAFIINPNEKAVFHPYVQIIHRWSQLNQVPAKYYAFTWDQLKPPVPQLLIRDGDIFMAHAASVAQFHLKVSDPFPSMSVRHDLAFLTGSKPIHNPSLQFINSLFDSYFWLTLFIVAACLNAILAKLSTTQGGFLTRWCTNGWTLIEPIICCGTKIKEKCSWTPKRRAFGARLLILAAWTMALLPVLEVAKGLIYSGIMCKQNDVTHSFEDAIKAHDQNEAIIFLNKDVGNTLSKEVNNSLWDNKLRSKILKLIEIDETNKKTNNSAFQSIVGSLDRLPSFIESRRVLFFDSSRICDCLIKSWNGYQIQVSNERHFANLQSTGFIKKQVPSNKRHLRNSFHRMMHQVVATGLAEKLESLTEELFQDFFRMVTIQKTATETLIQTDSSSKSSQTPLALVALFPPFFFLSIGIGFASASSIIERLRKRGSRHQSNLIVSNEIVIHCAHPGL